MRCWPAWTALLLAHVARIDDPAEPASPHAGVCRVRSERIELCCAADGRESTPQQRFELAHSPRPGRQDRSAPLRRSRSPRGARRRDAAACLGDGRRSARAPFALAGPARGRRGYAQPAAGQRGLRFPLEGPLAASSESPLSQAQAAPFGSQPSSALAACPLLCARCTASDFNSEFDF